MPLFRAAVGGPDAAFMINKARERALFNLFLATISPTISDKAWHEGVCSLYTEAASELACSRIVFGIHLLPLYRWLRKNSRTLFSERRLKPGSNRPTKAELAEHTEEQRVAGSISHQEFVEKVISHRWRREQR